VKYKTGRVMKNVRLFFCDSFSLSEAFVCEKNETFFNVGKKCLSDLFQGFCLSHNECVFFGWI
jgi:hypothetical protein